MPYKFANSSSFKMFALGLALDSSQTLVVRLHQGCAGVHRCLHISLNGFGLPF